MSSPNASATMTELSREQIASELTREMRTPLARVELAASQLAREAPTPAASEWAGGISEAVRELDRLVSRLLGVLTLERSPAGHDRDLHPVVASLRARFAPLLATRGITWEPSPEPGRLTRGDPDEVRILAVALLRIVTSLSDGGGNFRLDLIAEEDRTGLALRSRVDREPEGVSAGLDGRLLQELHAQAISRGAKLELRDGRNGRIATVWLPR